MRERERGGQEEEAKVPWSAPPIYFWAMKLILKVDAHL